MSLNNIKYETVLKALNPPQIVYSTQKVYDASCHFAGCQELVPVDVKISSQYFEEIMDKINNFKRIDIIPVEFEGELYLLENCLFSAAETNNNQEQMNATIYYDKFTIVE